MSVHIYVGNLGATTNEDSVRRAFVAARCAVRSVVILRSPQTDRSRGFGFVEFASEEDAQAATREMDGVEIEGRPIKVGPSRTRPAARGPGTSFHSYSGLGGRAPGGPRRPGGGGGAKRKRR
jgi:RNA recognition motif-containing protein